MANDDDFPCFDDEPFLGRGNDWILRPELSGIIPAQAYAVGLPPSSSDADMRLFCAIIVNLLLAARLGKWVSYSRNKDFYCGPKRYRSPDYTYYRVIKLVGALHREGLIDHQKAPQHQSPGRQSRMRATDGLVRVLEFLEPVTCRISELVCLRDAQKHDVDYAEDDATRSRRLFVAALNEMTTSLSISGEGFDLSQDAILVGDRPLLIAARASYRVFSQKWAWGGRYYGGFWQSLPKTVRETLLINGSRVREIDHKQLHPRLLYAMTGGKPDGDAYTIPGLPVGREEMKKAFQIMVNADNRGSAIHAVARKLGIDRKVANFRLDALERRHRRISEFFYTCPSRHLQYLDSELLTDVLGDLMHRGIPSLSIHDSVIVPEQHVSTVEGIMTDRLEGLLRDLRAPTDLRPRYISVASSVDL